MKTINSASLPLSLQRHNASWPLCMIALMSVLLLGCGSSDSESVSPENQDDGSVSFLVTLIAAGAEPRRNLSVRKSSDRLFSISASAERTWTFAGDEIVDSVSATYDVKADLSMGSDNVSLQLTPIPKSYSGGPVGTSATIDGRWDITYNTFGKLIDFKESSQARIARHNTLGVFDVPNWMLPVPDEAIGEGAVWTYDSIEYGGLTTHTVTVFELTDSSLKVNDTAMIKKSIIQNNFLFSSSNVGTYDTKTLLLRESEVTQEAGFESNVKRNQQEDRLISLARNTFTILEVLK